MEDDGRSFNPTDAFTELYGRYPPDGDDLMVLHQGEHAALSELLAEYCPVIYFSDGSSVINCVLHRPVDKLPMVPGTILSTIGWSGVDIRRESKPPRKPFSSNVQDRTVRWVRETLGPCILLDDDAAGELADVIALETCDNHVVVHLIHCKYSSEDTPGHRLKDVHDVICQAMRSARWASPQLFWRELARRRKQRPSTRILNADVLAAQSRLDDWELTLPATRFRVVVVQPGLQIHDVREHEAINALLVNCYEWGHDQGTEFLVIGS